MKNKTQLIKEIEKEIERINRIIDRKIIRGVPYTQEAKKHSQLIALLRAY